MPGAIPNDTIWLVQPMAQQVVIVQDCSQTPDHSEAKLKRL